MRSWLPAIAFGLVVGFAAIGATLGLRDGEAPTAADRADTLAAELRCPDCQGLSVADSPTRSAREIRRQIDELVAAGAGDDEVRAHFVARYGEWIRLAPSATSLWIIPFAAVVAGVVGLLAWLTLRRRTVAGPPARALTPEERRRLRDEVEALDA